MITENKDLRFGVNYVPSKEWFYSWQSFHTESFLRHTEEDFAAILSLGIDHIRLHLRWDLFQPNETYVSEEMLCRLKSVLDLAQKYGLQAEVTAFNGWMSGFWFLPSFAWQENLISGARQIENEIYFLTKLAEKIGDHPALLGIDFGNEFNVYGMMIKPFSVAEGDAWLKTVTGAANRLFAGKLNVLGVDHQPWFFDRYFSRRALANTGAATSIHAWAEFTGATEYGIFSEECLCLQEYSAELANAYARDKNRKVWMQEFGISPCWTEPKNFEKFVIESMKNALRSENLWGFDFWCSHDVSREYTFNEAEYGLGLFDVHNRIKPLGEIYKKAVAELRAGAKPRQLERGEVVKINKKEPFCGKKYLEIFAEKVRQGKHVNFEVSD